MNDRKPCGIHWTFKLLIFLQDNQYGRFITIEELDNWASWHGLMEDDMVNLRLLQLLADGIILRNEKEVPLS